MTTQSPDDPACKNTDRELWRERFGDFYADSIHVTERGGIGINCGGHVIVKPLHEWHALAARAVPAGENASGASCSMVASGAEEGMRDAASEPGSLEFMHAREAHYRAGLRGVLDDFGADYLLTTVVAMLVNRDSLCDSREPDKVDNWKARKRAVDAADDGNGPYMHWICCNDDVAARRKALRNDFEKDWCYRHLGQGYSLACCDGGYVENVTDYAFKAYVAGREYSEPSAGAAVQDATQMQGQDRTKNSIYPPDARIEVVRWPDLDEPDQPEPRQQEPNQSTEANKGEQS
jgi:hypothetical protein